MCVYLYMCTFLHFYLYVYMCVCVSPTVCECVCECLCECEYVCVCLRSQGPVVQSDVLIQRKKVQCPPSLPWLPAGSAQRFPPSSLDFEGRSKDWDQNTNSVWCSLEQGLRRHRLCVLLRLPLA